MTYARSLLVSLLVLSSSHAWASYTVGKFYYQGHTKEKVIALTFDDGPGKFTLPILELLQKNNIHATFFMEGSQVEDYPKIAKQVFDAGHEIGNHTYTHFDFHAKKNATPERLVHELEQTEATLNRATGYHTTVVRMPYGYYNHTWLMPTLKAHGYALVHWSFGEDWLRKRPRVKSDPTGDSQPMVELTPEVLASDYIKHAMPGAVFLFHDGGRHRERTLAAVTIVVETLEKQGYKFIPAREMFPE